MDTSIYIALSKETGIFRDLEVTANNLANVNTSGYQGEDLLFNDYLTAGSNQEGKVAFTNDIATYRNIQQGSLQVTNAPLDAAIEGRGYFAVQTPLGTRYTRNGNFKIDPNGNLTTSEGYTVLDDSNQAITFDTIDRKIDIREDGGITVDGGERGNIKIVQFDNEQLMHKVGNTLYTSDATPRPADNYRVVAGALERSNVQPFTAITHLLYVTRSASDTANLINTMYTLERNASNTLAKIYT